jgi:hypothetical protein
LLVGLHCLAGHTFGQTLESVTKAQPNNAQRVRIVSTPDRSERPPEQQDNTETPEPGEHARAIAKEMAGVGTHCHRHGRQQLARR